MILAPGPSPSPATVITTADQLTTLLSNDVAIADATLTTNAPAITVAGTYVSLGDSGLVIDSSTIPLPSLSPKPLITLAGHTYAISQLTDGVVVAGTTLQVGQSAITMSGTAIVLESSGLVIGGTSTLPIASINGAQPTSNGIGGFIFAGINSGPAAKPSTAGATSSNGAQTNNTGAAGGLEIFQGRGAKVVIQLDILAEIAAMMLFMSFLF